jgi:Resolvase, N terminal domain
VNLSEVTKRDGKRALSTQLMYPLDFTNLKIVKHRRKSSEDEDRQVASLGDQATALDEVAARFHIRPAQIVADFGESRSAKRSQTRLEFENMVTMIEQGGANAILTWRPDRLSRNLGDVDKPEPEGNPAQVECNGRYSGKWNKGRFPDPPITISCILSQLFANNFARLIEIAAKSILSIEEREF